VGDTQDEIAKVKMVGQMLEYLVGQQKIHEGGPK
jgi:hypothetical protein